MIEIIFDRNKAIDLAQHVYALLDDWEEGKLFSLIINPRMRELKLTLVDKIEDAHLCPDCRQKEMN